MSTNLDAQVRAALMTRKGDWQAVATGADVSYSWLTKFANGRIDNPAYFTLIRLRDFLKTGKPQKADAATGKPKPQAAPEQAKAEA